MYSSINFITTPIIIIFSSSEKRRVPWNNNKGCLELPFPSLLLFCFFWWPSCCCAET